MASLIEITVSQWDLKSWLGIVASVFQDPFLTNVAFPVNQAAVNPDTSERTTTVKEFIWL